MHDSLQFCVAARFLELGRTHRRLQERAFETLVFSSSLPSGRWSLWAGRARPKRFGEPSGEIAVERSGTTGFSTPPAESTGLSTRRVANPPPALGPGNTFSHPSGHAGARSGRNGHRPPRSLQGRSVLNSSGMLLTVLFPADQGMNRGTKQAHPMPLERSTISVSRGYADAAVWVNTLQRPSYSPGWCTLLTTTTILSQRAEPSPLWFRTFPKHPIRRGTTRIFRRG